MAEARRRSLRVLRAVCGSAASLLGPVQALKALEDDTEPRLVADALGVLEILDVQHPIAQLLREAVFAQHAAHGSGTTQLMALIGALCVEAEALERAGLPPAAIAHGFAEAAERCLATADELAVDTDQLLDAGAPPTASVPTSRHSVMNHLVAPRAQQVRRQKMTARPSCLRLQHHQSLSCRSSLATSSSQSLRPRLKMLTTTWAGFSPRMTSAWRLSLMRVQRCRLALRWILWPRRHSRKLWPWWRMHRLQRSMGEATVARQRCIIAAAPKRVIVCSQLDTAQSRSISREPPPSGLHVSKNRAGVALGIISDLLRVTSDLAHVLHVESLDGRAKALFGTSGLGVH